LSSYLIIDHEGLDIPRVSHKIQCRHPQRCEIIGQWAECSGFIEIEIFVWIAATRGASCKKLSLKERQSMNDTEERVRAIIVDLLGVDEDQVTLEKSFREDLEADSLDLVELIMAFEEEFEGEISDEEAQKITTVGEAVNYINSSMRS